MTKVEIFEGTGTLRSSSSFTPEEVASVDDSKLERFKKMHDAMIEHENAATELRAAEDRRAECVIALDEIIKSGPKPPTAHEAYLQVLRAQGWTPPPPE